MINLALFLISIVGFLWVLVHNAERRRAVIANAIHLPLPGCPSIHSGIEWAQWIPGMYMRSILSFSHSPPSSDGLRGDLISLGHTQDLAIHISQVEGN